MGRTIKCKCFQCGRKIDKSISEYNRATKNGRKLFCNKKCYGLYKRKPVDVKKERSRLYSVEYRKKHSEYIKKRKREYFKKDYAENPKKYIAIRKARQQKHNAYCSTPEYKIKKKAYDQQYRAKTKYGGYADASIALLELAKIVDNRQAKIDQQIFNKSQKRKRNGKDFKREKLESCVVGLYQPS